MAIAKVVVSCLLFVAVAVAMPQATVDENGEMFDPNPQYTYSYQVSDDSAQTYLAHNENRDGEQVNGQYSYVDPLGSLITVKYTSGVMGYTETRDVQENFVAIRSLPSSGSASAFSSSASSASSSASSSGAAATGGVVRQVVQSVQPIVQSVVRQETLSSNDDGDLVSRIISQLTPYIQETVSSSLSGGRASSTTTTLTSQQSARPISVVSQAAPVVRTVVAQPIAVAAPVRQTSSSSVEGIFGLQGQNNVRVETPNFNFAYDLAK